jgi:hypothetical protein
MNDSTELIWALEAEYERDVGFLGRLRRGEFDREGLDRLVKLVESIDFGDALTINRRVVSLLWGIPTFMGWQSDRVAQKHGDVNALRHGIDKLETTLNTVLGTP